MKLKQWILKREKRIAAALLFAAAGYPAMAQTGASTSSKMASAMTQMLDIMRGPPIRILMVMLLVGTAIAFGYNKDNEKMKRGCVAVAIAIGLIFMSTEIVNLIWQAAGG